jgi:hypothetical protein
MFARLRKRGLKLILDTPIPGIYRLEGEMYAIQIVVIMEKSKAAFAKRLLLFPVSPYHQSHQDSGQPIIVLDLHRLIHA